MPHQEQAIKRPGPPFADASTGKDQPSPIIIADEHPVVIYGVTQSLKDVPHIEVVGDASWTSKLIVTLQSTPCQILITGFHLCANPMGVDLLRYLRHSYPHMRIIALVHSHVNAAAIRYLLQHGVSAVVSKGDELEDIPQSGGASSSGCGLLAPIVAAALGDDRTGSKYPH